MRNETITIAKGLGIILMVIGHSGCPDLLYNFIYMFHMPLFFFLSGYCFKEKYLYDSKSYVRRKIKSIYFPYIKWCVIFCLMHNVFVYFNVYNEKIQGEIIGSYYSIGTTVKKLLYIIGGIEWEEPLLTGLWFLKQLFIGNLLAYMIFCFSKRLNINILVGGVISLFISLLMVNLNFNTPGLIGGRLSFLATFFIVVGQVFSKIKIRFSFGIALVLLSIVFLGSILVPSSMRNFTSEELIPYVFFSITGILMGYIISDIIYKSNYLSLKKTLIYIGDRTMIILVWHYLLFKSMTLILIWVEKRDIYELAWCPVIKESSFTLWILYSITGVFLPLLLNKFYYNIKIKLCLYFQK